MDKRDWNYEAKIIFKKILEERNIKYNDLVHALNDRGIDESYNSIVTKVNRGTFSFAPDLGDGSTINPNTGEITNGVHEDFATVLPQEDLKVFTKEYPRPKNALLGDDAIIKYLHLN